MSSEVVSYADAAARFERDRKVFRQRLAGVPERQIAEDLGCSLTEVGHSLARMCGGVPTNLRSKTIIIELERLDDLFQIFYAKAQKGDHESCHVCIRLMERRSKMLGLDAPPRSDTALEAAQPKQQHSVDRILAAIERVARGPVIEGEVVKE